MVKMPTLHLYLLGQLRLVYGDVPVALSSPRLQSLLAYLVLRRGVRHSRRHLAFLLWPDSTEAQAHTNLRKSLHHLRRALPAAEQFLELLSSTIAWREDANISLDVAEFEQATEPAASAETLKHAVEIYRGDLLPGFYDDWILSEREGIRQRFSAAVDRLVSGCEEQADFRGAITYAQRLLQHDPLREETYRRLMHLQMATGDRAAALRTYYACATALRREFNVEPGPATRAAYERLIEAGTHTASPAPAPPLVGRNAEWGQLQTALQGARLGRPRMAIIRGEAGLGKTRLAEELLDAASRQDICIASAQCYGAGDTLAFAPVISWLRAQPLAPLDPLWLTEIARLLPQLLIDHPGLAAPRPLSEVWQQHRFFEALARAVLARQPLVLLIDDLQWCDRETLRWLSYLMQYEPHSQLLLVGTARLEDLTLDHPLLATLSSLHRSGQLVEIDLAPLNAVETQQLAIQVTGHPIDAAQAASLYAETEGNPLFIFEMARAGWPSSSFGLPATIQATIESRMAQLSPGARDLLAAAATLGSSFTPDMLAQIGQVTEDQVVHGLDELWRRRIVREHGQDTYDFTHGKLREVILAQLSHVRSRRLHQRIAEALELKHAAELEPVSAAIASHFEAAGQPDRAAAYYSRAGDAARRVYANDAAQGYYRRALLRLKDSERILAILSLGGVLELVGQWSEAEALYRQAVPLAQTIAAPELAAKSEAALGQVLHLAGRYAEALAWLTRARDHFDALGDQAGAVKVLENMGLVYDWQGNYEDALRCHVSQLELANELGDAQGVGRALGAAGLVHWQQGRYAEALECFDQQLRRANESSDKVSADRAIGNTGLIHWEQGDYTGARRCYQQQLQVADEIGDRVGQSYALGNLGILHEEQGELRQALDYYARQLKIVLELNERRSISHAAANMGIVYADRGEYSRAVRCGAVSLQIGLEVGDRRIMGHALGNLAGAYAAQKDYALASRLYQSAQAVFRALDLPHPLCQFVYEHGQMLAAQGQGAEAWLLTTEARRLAKQIGRKDIRFKAYLASLRLAPPADPAAIVREIERGLADWPTEQEQATAHDTAWAIDRTRDDHRQLAADAYRRLYRRTGRAEYRLRYQELTAKRLPAARPLPDALEQLAVFSADLNALLAEVDSVVERLQTPSAESHMG